MHQRHVNALQRTPEEIRNHYLAEKELQIISDRQCLKNGELYI